MTTAPASLRATSRTVQYLRVVVTARCSLACAYCHAEGDWAAAGTAGGLPLAELAPMLRAAVAAGVRKVKLLGGEPLLRPDLPEIVRTLLAADPTLDVSLITAGAVPVARLDAAFAAGLTRANLSIHGWEPEEFAARTRRPAGHAMREKVLARLLEHGRFLKLNYVYRGPDDEADLGAFLAWAASRSVTVGLLDDLGRDIGPGKLLEALARVRGPWAEATDEPDPYSLPTLILRWRDGLRVEVKNQRLGDVSPWNACVGCPQRARCGEGIHAVRLTHEGRLRPCMDRTELGVDLRAAFAAGGERGVLAAWTQFVRQALA